MAHQFKHPHVEDYIEIIAGFREPSGKSNHSIFTIGEPLINLARYDMKVVPSLAEQSIGGKGYTDKQAKLATELVIKYERQLAKHNIDITPVKTPVYRLPLRIIDRTTRTWVEDNLIKLRFPYDTKLIEIVRDACKESKGEFKFNRDTRVHEAALTEWNLNWIHSFAQANNFEVDASVTELMKLLLEAEQQSYSIELNYKTDETLTIINAADSLIEYINEHLGGFALDNILTLIDYAPILGYSVNKSIEDDIINNVGTRFWSLCANKQLKVDTMTSSTIVKDIIDFSKLTNRFPIYVYEADLSNRLLNEFNRFLPGQIVRLDKKEEITEDAKVVYTTKIPRKPIGRIPLLVSSAGMLFGGDRQVWIQNAEKVVYFTKDVYTKNSKGPEVCKLD
jgi:hypothetical protein